MEREANLQQALIGFAVIIILFLVGARIENLMSSLY